MKKPLLYLSLFMILFAVACTSRTNNQQAVQPAAPAFDTTGLADFQEWKFLNERKEAADYMQQEAVVTAPVKTVQKRTVAKKPAVKAPVVNVPQEETEAPSTQGTSNDENGTVASTGSNEAKEKKGISNTVKGTVIGAVSGAVLGAVINKKNRVVGGVVGGVLGGGVGYGIGRKMDKKKEEQQTTQQATETPKVSELANIFN